MKEIIFKMILIILIIVFSLIIIENIRKKIAPTKNQKRKNEKKSINIQNGDYDETLKVNERLTENKDFTHGTGRFSSETEKESLVDQGKLKKWKIGEKIQKNNAGIVIGIQNEDTLLYNGGDEHATILSNTGGGKTTTFVEPTLLLLAHSEENIFAFDPKQEEVKKLSSFFTKMNYDVYNFNLNNKEMGGRWNPFWIAWEKYNSNDLKIYYEGIDEISKLESLLFEIDKNEKGSEPIWENSEKGIYGLGILLMFELIKRKKRIFEYYKENKNELNVKTIFFEDMLIKRGEECETTVKMLIDNKSYEEIEHSINMSINFGTLLNIIRYISRRENKIPKIQEIIENDMLLQEFENIIYIKAEILLDSAEETYQSQMATPKAKLQKLNNPLIVDLLSGYPGLKGYIDIEKIVATDKNIIFCNVREDDRTFSYISQMFITQIYSSLKTEADKQPEAKLTTKFHFLLEEFGNLPKIEGLAGMLTLSRGIGIRFYLVLQSFAQFTLVYGADIERIIKSNTMLMVLPVNDYSTAKEVSDILGNATIEDIIIDEELETKGSNELLGNKAYKLTTRTQNISRAIKTPDELLIIQMGEVYIKKQQLRPFFGKMPISFENKNLQKFYYGNKKLEERKLEKYTLQIEEVDYLLKRKNPKEYLNSLEREEIIKIEIL